MSIPATKSTPQPAPQAVAMPAKASPAAPVAKKSAAGNRKLLPMIIGGVVAVVVIAAGIWFLLPEPPPKFTAPTFDLVKYINSKKYQGLQHSEKLTYMRVIEDRDDNKDLKRLLDSKQITEDEYRTAKLEGWMAQQLSEVDKYFGKSGAERQEWLARQVAKDIKDKGDADADSTTKPIEEPKPDPKTGEPKKLKIDIDPTAKQMRVEGLAPDVKERYLAFRKAWDEEENRQKEVRRKEREGAAKPATAA